MTKLVTLPSTIFLYILILCCIPSPATGFLWKSTKIEGRTRKMGILILYNWGRGEQRVRQYGTSFQQTNILPVISSYINFLSFVFLKVYFRNKLHGVPGRAALPQQFIPTICGVPEASRMFCHLTQNPEAFHVFLPIFIHTMSVSNT